MTTTRTDRICAGFEPIPGYVLEERIGQGGFGEVWRASAPGGLKKAVKFVFGAHDQSRAIRELRSLERIRGVQHPFLLTLERFEAIDQQLVIVTELADCSLEDVFRKNLEGGSCGIARDVLISHLHDAADALDYLHQRYQLQHLDIKPANLLLVGGHVKVADFGLIKDLREVECSVVGGLTPIYAPPELFDGRPSLHSDQYSLAVMYQELLTGTRPFGGRTIAQLATQHVHSAPNLEALPPNDRPIVAKALEKNPERRFPNCTAFVQAIRDSLRRNVGSSSVVPVPCELDSPPAKIEDLPQLSAGGPTRTSHAQVMLVALGGTGAECLQELRGRAANVHTASPFDLHSVLIDTDRATIDSMRVAESSDRVPACKLIHTPLRTPHQYRQSGTGRLGTISRRWIYNVPRSGKTEGMRPLGRLALVDHGPEVKQSLSEAVEALCQVCEGHSPRVYVVGSLTGGTSSGIYIDVVHLLRHLLDEAGLVESEILSMLATPPLQCDPTRPLAAHDCQAAMNELKYFLQAGNGYPGDQGAGWPSVPAARTPLKNLYLVGGPTRTSLTPTAVATITDYLWSDVTGAGDLLAEARKLELAEGQSVVPPSIRTVGVVPLSDPKEAERKMLAPAAVRELLIRWLGLPSAARQDSVPLCQRVLRRIGLSTESILDQTTKILESQSDHSKATDANDLDVKSLLGSPPFRKFVRDVVNKLHREFTVCLIDARADLTTVIECLKRMQEWTDDCCTAMAIEPSSESDEPLPESRQATTARRMTTAQAEQLRRQFRELQERLEDFATTLAVSIVETTKLQSTDSNPWNSMPDAIQEQFDATVTELHSNVASQFLVRSLDAHGYGAGAAAMVDQISEAATPLITAMLASDGQRSVSGIKSGLGSARDLEGGVDLAATAALSTCVAESLSNTAATQAIGNFGGSSNDGPMTIEEALLAVQPSLLSLGGLQRLMLIVGSQQEKSQLEPQIREVHEGSLTVAVIPGTRPKLIHEGQQIELSKILSRWMVLNGGNEQVTARLASRSDIDW